MPRKPAKTTRTTTSERNAELEEFGQTLRGEEIPPTKSAGSQRREAKSKDDEARAAAKEQFFKSQAEMTVRLVEESGKPFVAGLMLGDRAAECFKTPEHKWRMLVDPLAAYMKAVQFEPESPLYHLVVLLSMWGFITYEQYGEFVKTAPAPRASGVPAATSEKPSWVARAVQTASSVL